MDKKDKELFKKLIDGLEEIDNSLMSITDSIDEIAKEVHNIEKLIVINEKIANTLEKQLYIE